MDRSAAPNDGVSPGGQKRRRKDPVNASRQELLRARVDQERVDPNPVSVLGPVPSIRDQTAALLRDPAYLVQEMKRAASDTDHPGMDELPLSAWDWSDEEPDITTGYEVHEMQPIPVLEDPDPTAPPSDSHAAAQEPRAPKSEAPPESRDAPAEDPPEKT